MTSHLPIELIELIIDKLIEAPKSDVAHVQRDLRACSLVCRSFVTLCQRHIFAQVQVGPSIDGGLTRNRLAMALQGNASLACFIKRVVYFRSGDAKPENINAPSPHLSVLLHLPQVQRLEIVCADLSFNFDRVISEPYGASHFFEEYISSSSLTSLSIQGANFIPLHIILSQPNLRRLRLVACGISTTGTSSPAPAPKALQLLDLDNISSFWLACFRTRMRLNTLSLRHSFRGFFGSPSLKAVLPSLKKLRINTVVFNAEAGPYEETIIQNDILESATRLEGLVVEAMIMGPSTQFPLRIQECVSNTRASLKHLHLYYTLQTAAMIHDGIYNILSAVQGQNIIQEVDIIVFFQRIFGISPTLQGVVVPTLETWSMLDELLDEDRSLFPYLRKVHIQILILETKYDQVHGAGQGVLDEFRKGVGRSFTRLLASPKIEFRLRVGTDDSDSYEFPETYMF
ncbi:hypothetical protein BJ165DRAFT_1611933 [Panaeolus papilionaceus]|nr:hypothetical protein BJ165DRAFT_1611933 [Panaeolus papilionaceus]